MRASSLGGHRADRGHDAQTAAVGDLDRGGPRRGAIDGDFHALRAGGAFPLRAAIRGLFSLTIRLGRRGLDISIVAPRDVDRQGLRLLRDQHADPERGRQKRLARGGGLWRVLVVAPVRDAEVELLVPLLVLALVSGRLVGHEEAREIPARRCLRQRLLRQVGVIGLGPDEIEAQRADEVGPDLVGRHRSASPFSVTAWP